MNAGVAVIIPAFNHARFVAEAVDSVLAQDYPNVDLLVIDDGSTDDTPRVLERYGARLRWYSRENLGQSATLNEGWSSTEGGIPLTWGPTTCCCPGPSRPRWPPWRRTRRSSASTGTT